MPVRSYRGKWVADYTDQFGNRSRPSFATRRDAKDHLTKVENEIRNLTYRPEASKTKLKDSALGFLAYNEARVELGELERATVKNYSSVVERYIIASRDLSHPNYPEGKGEFFDYPLGNLSLSDVSPAQVDRFRLHVSQRGLKPSSVKATIMILGLVLEWAKDNNLIATNVIKGMKRRKNRREDDEELIIPEKGVIAALYEHASPYAGLIIQFAAATGLRSSEQRALQWRHIDFDGRTVSVKRRVDRYNKIGPPKTKAGRRTVPISPILVQALKSHRATSKFPAVSDLIFPNGLGRFEAHGNWVTRYYNPAWEKAEEQWREPEELKRCRWHFLRHFAISTWIAHDVPIKQIQRWAGHSTAAMTLDIYGHLFKSADHSGIFDEIADDVWGSIRQSGTDMAQAMETQE